MTRPVDESLAGLVLARGTASAGGGNSRASLEGGAFAGLFDSQVDYAPWQHGLAPARDPQRTGQAAEAAEPRPMHSAAAPPSRAGDAGAAAPGEGRLSAQARISMPGLRGQAAAAGATGLVRGDPPAGGEAPATPHAVRYQWSRTALSVCVCGGELDVAVRDPELASTDELRQALERFIAGLRLSSLKVNGVRA